MRLLAFICFTAGSVLAADDPKDWKRHPSVAEEFTNSKCVFVGEVLSSRQILEKDGFIQGTFYIVRIQELLKGRALKNVEIYDENSSGRFPMKAGERYLLFAYEGPFEGIDGPCLAIDRSGNSETLKQAKKTLAIVRKLKNAQ